MKKNTAKSGLVLIVSVFVLMPPVSVCHAETAIQILARKHAAKSGNVGTGIDAETKRKTQQRGLTPLSILEG